ncbi:PQQ-dependent sugar dehydrogenase [bacterium]|nr:PQQ-dependent sugar dehydrogenase [bacterium]
MKTRPFVVSTFLILLSCGLAVASVPTGFTETQLASGLTAPTAMAMAPDGRIFICQQGGALRVFKNGSLLATPFLNVTVNSSGERGLLGIAFDPDFVTNQFIYVYYTATTPTIHNRVSRFTANGDVVVSGSEAILLELPNLSATNHNGGAIHFGLDGKLYIAVGENAVGSNSQSMNTILGKILRMNKDGTIPTDNPFYNTASGINRLIWALGLRNPFTFSVQPGTGRIFINDVGAGAWEEINDQPPIPPPPGFPNPRNYGWPNAEGATMCSTYLCPKYAYPHSGGTVNGCAITGGAFYNPTTQQFPAEYVGNYFFADYCGDWIKKLDVSTNAVTNFATPTAVTEPVDLLVSPDGSLYYLARGGGGSNGVLFRIQFTGGQAPSITTHPSNQTVTVGGSATFTVVASGTAPLSYQWQRNNADISGATSASYTLNNAQLSDSGAQFRCVVTNSFGTATSNQAQLTVVQNNPPVASITAPANGSPYNAGTTINYSGDGTDPEDITIPANGFTWWVDFHHDDHTHPHVLPTSGSKTGSFNIPSTGETDDNQWYRIYLTVTDSGGLQNTTFVEIFPRKATITLASNPTGLQLKLDGATVTAPHQFVGVVGMIRNIEAVSPQGSFNFVSWSDGGAISHNITTPSANTTYTATFNSVAPNGDGLRGTYYNNSDFTGTTFTRVDPTVNFNWAKGAPAPGIAGDTFSVRWTGFVQPQFSETYTFRTDTDDGVRLWVNGVQIINRWVNNAGVSTGTIALTGGQKYAITLEMYEHKNKARAILQWSSPSQALQVIPQSRLYSQ